MFCLNYFSESYEGLQVWILAKVRKASALRVALRVALPHNFEISNAHCAVLLAPAVGYPMIRSLRASVGRFPPTVAVPSFGAHCNRS